MTAAAPTVAAAAVENTEQRGCNNWAKRLLRAVPGALAEPSSSKPVVISNATDNIIANEESVWLNVFCNVEKEYI